jgi:hypothetical protein
MAGMTTAVSGVLLRVTAIILLQIFDRHMQCIESCHDNVECGFSRHLCEVLKGPCDA